MDMLGSLNGAYFITDPIIPLTVNTGIIITPHNNSNILTAMLKQAFINIGITPTSCAFTGLSDYKWFAHAGIPSVALSTVDYTLTNPTSSFDTCYHQQCDDLNNVDLDMATNCTIAMFNLLKKLVTTQNFFNVE